MIINGNFHNFKFNYKFICMYPDFVFPYTIMTVYTQIEKNKLDVDTKVYKYWMQHDMKELSPILKGNTYSCVGD